MNPDLSSQNLNQKSEIQIIQEVLSGRKEAYSQLVCQYYRLCVHFLTSALKIDRETAYDLTQETFIRAYKGLHGFDISRPFRPWLMKICRNLAIDKLKKESKNNHELFANPEGRPDDQTDSLAEHLDLKNAIAELPPRQQEIIEMHYFWGLTCSDIAEILALPSGTVKSDLHFARRHLLRILEKDL